MINGAEIATYSQERSRMPPSIQKSNSCSSSGLVMTITSDTAAVNMLATATPVSSSSATLGRPRA